MSNLKELLAWVAGGPGAGVLAYWLLEHVGALKALAPEAKRYVAFALSGGLAALAWYLSVVCGFVPAPEPTVVGWLDALVGVILLAVTTNQVTHARLVLAKREAYADGAAAK